MPDVRPTEVLLNEVDIRERVRELANDIGRDHPNGVHLVAVLRGAFVFLADLAREMTGPVSIDFVATSSYSDAATRSGVPRLVLDTQTPLQGKDVVIVEDIVDEGLTLALLQEKLLTQSPHSLRTACLLNKPARRQRDVRLDYVGFTIDDHFVVGYGLDHAGRYRNLPYIAILR